MLSCRCCSRAARGANGRRPRDKRSTASGLSEIPRPGPAGTVNIPLDELEKRTREIPAGDVVVMDHSGGQSLIAGRVLHKAGRQAAASRLEGGLLGWQQKGLPVEEKALAERQ